MANLRWFQSALKEDIYNGFREGKKRVLAVSPTGSGKTVLMGAIAKEWNGPGIAIAHRQELVSQISMALAKEGIPHDVHASEKVRKIIRGNHMRATGRQWIKAGAAWRVAGVDTLIKMEPDAWMGQTTLILQDEAHHVLKNNKWGRAWEMFPNAYGLGVTATPERTEGKGLGASTDGVFEELYERAGMRQLIEECYLTDYQVVAPSTEGLGLDMVEVSATTGDYNETQLRKHMRNNPKVVGDVVDTYIKFAKGKLGVTFCTGIEHAENVAAEYRRKGVKAEVLSGKTPDELRQQLLRDFAAQKFDQIVSVDILGEGFDLPAIEVVSFARPTQSLSLFMQQCGRALRLMITDEQAANWEFYTIEERRAIIAASRKPYALILDHVGAFVTHKAPDKPRVWSLARRTRSASTLKGDAIALRTCLNVECLNPYERDLLTCPKCGLAAPLPADRSGPTEVDGDLELLDAATLAQLRGQVFDPLAPVHPPRSAGPAAVGGFWKHHNNRAEAQSKLREAIALWAGKWSARPDRVNYRRFFLTFGIDVVSACALGTKEAEELTAKIMENIYA